MSKEITVVKVEDKKETITENKIDKKFLNPEEFVNLSFRDLFNVPVHLKNIANIKNIDFGKIADIESIPREFLDPTQFINLDFIDLFRVPVHLSAENKLVNVAINDDGTRVESVKHTLGIGGINVYSPDEIGATFDRFGVDRDLSKIMLFFQPGANILGDFTFQRGFLITNVVTTSFDSINAGDGQLSFREAIFQANHNIGNGLLDEINLSPHTTYFLTIPSSPGSGFGLRLFAATANDSPPELGGDLDIMDDLVIHGNGSVIKVVDENGQPAATDRIFEIYPGVVLELNDLTLEFGSASGVDGENGGAILNREGKLILNNVAIISSTAVGMGGAIYNDRGEIEINFSEISYNKAELGGGIYNYQGTITINTSTFSNNEALYAGMESGSAIYNDGGIVLINNSTLAFNKNTGLYSIDGEVLLVSTAVTKNGFDLVGEHYISGGYNFITDPTNSDFPISGSLNDILFNNNSGLVNSLGSSSSQDTLINITPLSLFGQSPESRSIGGAYKLLLLPFNSLNEPSALIDKGSNPLGITHDIDGGLRQLGPGVDIGVDEVFSYSVQTAFPFRDSASDPLGLRYQIIQANQDNVANYINLLGGVTYRIDLTGANENNGLTGDLDITNGIVHINGNGATIEVIGNVDRLFDVIGANTQLVLENVTLVGGFANMGGAIRNEGTVGLINVKIIDNTADVGGAVYNADGASLFIYNSQLTQNTANQTGGAIYQAGKDAYFEIHRTNIEDNSAQSGGGIYALGSGLIYNSSVYANTAADQGGGIVFAEPNVEKTLSVLFSTVSSNEAVNGSGGGILSLNNATVFLNYSTVARNIAGEMGQGIQTKNNGIVVILNSIVAENGDNYSHDIAGNNYVSLGYNLIPDITLSNFSPLITDFVNIDPSLVHLDEAALNIFKTIYHGFSLDSLAYQKGDDNFGSKLFPVAYIFDQNGNFLGVADRLDIGAITLKVPSLLIESVNDIVLGQNAQFKISLENFSVAEEDILISYQTNDGTANSNLTNANDFDYFSQTGIAVISKGESFVIIEIPTNVNANNVDIEDFSVSLLAVLSGFAKIDQPSALVNIYDSDLLPTASIDVSGTIEINEGELLVIPIVLSTPVFDEITLTFSINPDIRGSFGFASKTITPMDIDNDGVVDPLSAFNVEIQSIKNTQYFGERDFVVTLTSVSNVSNSLPINIDTNANTLNVKMFDLPPAISINKSSVGNEGGDIVFTIEREFSSFWPNATEINFEIILKNGVTIEDFVLDPQNPMITVDPLDSSRATGVIMLAGGTAAASLALTLKVDAEIENETFSIKLLNAVDSQGNSVTISNAQATGTIVDYIVPNVSILPLSSDSVGKEGDSHNSLIKIDRLSDKITSVNYQVEFLTASIDDFGSVPFIVDPHNPNIATGVFEIGANQSSGILSLPLLNDFITEGSEQFKITLLSASDGTAAPINIDTTANTIIGKINDLVLIPEVSVKAISTGIEGGNAPIEFDVLNPNGKDISVNFQINLLTASISDFNFGSNPLFTIDPRNPTVGTGTFVIGANQSSGILNLPLLNDSLIEGPEQFTLTLLSASDGTINATANTATGTINDPPPIPEVSINPLSSGTEGGIISFIFSVLNPDPNLPAISVSYLVDLSMVSMSDFRFGSVPLFSPLPSDPTVAMGTFVIGAGQSSATLNISLNRDSLIEGTEEFKITLLSATAGSTSVNLSATENISFGTIKDPGIPPVVFDLDGDGVELLSPEQGIKFYSASDDTYYQLGWVSADDGILVFDANGDKNVDILKEVALAQYHPDAKTDLEGLALAFDSNKDNIFDSLDTEYHSFGIWQDLNQNGQSEQGEFSSLSDLGITQINLNRSDDVAVLNNNIIYGYSQYISATQGKMQIADVALSIFPVNETDKQIHSADVISEQDKLTTLLNSLNPSAASHEAEVSSPSGSVDSSTELVPIPPSAMESLKQEMPDPCAV